MSVETSSVVIETMIVNTKTKQNRRSSFGSSVNNAKLDNYIRQNIIDDQQSSSPGQASTRSMKDGDTISGYVPSFDGYLDIGFSIHVPCGNIMEDCQLAIDDAQQGRLESLVMLYLCSQNVELVISTSPNSLVHVCPFKNDNSRSSVSAKTKSSENIILGDDDEYAEPLILWNLPRFETETIAFDEHPGDSKTVLDMATNTSMYLSSEPLQYYSQLTFTYPVYQWGSMDPSIAAALQEGFDQGVISSGTLNSLLPWSDALAAPTGGEPYAFWNEPLPGPFPYYDTTLPEGVGVVLRWIGVIIMVANTLVCVVLTLIASRRNQRLEAWAKQRDEEARMRYEASSQRGFQSDYLDTEAGISAILMESKNYAMAKGSHGDRNISGVEVDLKMVDHPSHLLTHHQSFDQKAMSPEEKEEDLLARARYRSTPVQGVSTLWYSNKNLLTNSNNGEDDYDDETDLQILDLSSPSKQERDEC